MTQQASTPDALIERLRSTSQGYDEWRVQDPKDGSYCISFNWREVMNPERMAREWLADHCRRFPGGLHTDFVVACVRVHSQADKLMLEAAAEIERLRADYEGACKLVADMHAAATGRPGEGPRLGVVEDVAAVAAVAVEAERLRAEAARYRWLTTDGERIGERMRGTLDKWDGCDGKAGFDEAIDAAMRDAL